jgi:hypothetical protein
MPFAINLRNIAHENRSDRVKLTVCYPHPLSATIGALCHMTQSWPAPIPTTLHKALIQQHINLLAQILLIVS